MKKASAILAACIGSSWLMAVIWAGETWEVWPFLALYSTPIALILFPLAWWCVHRRDVMACTLVCLGTAILAMVASVWVERRFNLILDFGRGISFFAPIAATIAALLYCRFTNSAALQENSD